MYRLLKKNEKKGKLMNKCSIKECNFKHHAKGYCNQHYLQIKRNGLVNKQKPIQMLFGEMFKTIPSYPDYKISNYGRVVNTLTLKLLKNQPRTVKGQYFEQVKLNTKHLIKIHTTIAKTFIPNTQNDTCIIFLDGDSTNIQLGNIQWRSLYKKQSFIKALQEDHGIISTAISNWLNNKPRILNDLIKQNYANFKYTCGYILDYNPALIDDTVQEGLIRALISLKKGALTNIENFFGWIAAIIRNVAKNTVNFERRYISENQTNANGESFSLIDTGMV